MQTLTHLAIGFAAAATFFPNQPLAQAACIVSSAGPDVVMMPLFALDKLRGRQPLADQGPLVLNLKEVTHSVVVSAVCLALGRWFDQTLLVAFAFGWIVHVVIDIYTHGDPEFQKYGDPHYVWPLNLIPGLTHASLRGLGRWDYRIKVGQLWPLKPIELWVLIVSITITPVAWFAR